jgi:4-oxalocrotonate tautomerase
MPLVRIDLARGTSLERRRAISHAVHDAMVEALAVPAEDRFQVIAEHAAENFVVDLNYLGIERSEQCVIIQITLNAGRTVEIKKNFYRTLADHLGRRAGVRREDVFVSLVEVAKENWSFGNGEAQYAP